jgi:hypothetical protein
MLELETKQAHFAIFERALETTRSQRTSVQTPASLPRGHVIFERTGC